MKAGDLVYFDAFYHDEKKYRGLHPREYAILGVILRKCSPEDESWGLNVESWKSRPIYEVFAENIYFPAPEISLVLADKTVK
jgi:hypothetical protein